MRRLGCVFWGAMLLAAVSAAEELKVGVFDIDASPPIGSHMAYDPVKEVLLPLSCRGIVLTGAERPIVICAVDWIGIGNETHRTFREQLAKSAGTTADRVALHCLHQHDAPWCDITVDQLLVARGITYRPFDSVFARETFTRAAAAVAKAVQNARPVNRLGLGAGEVEKVASNRRVLGPDGKVLHIRWSATKDAAAREFPEGIIDPTVKMISFWHDERPVAALSYYATHPQSYYRTGKANPDFPGIARNQTQEQIGVPLIHLNGAGGNITAGKYNDGNPDNRQILADRLAAGMTRAWKATKTTPLTVADVGWKTAAVALPAAPHFEEKALSDLIDDASKPIMQRFTAATELVWLKRCQAQEAIDLSCLQLKTARVLHLPGELFIEYQLAAQKLRPDCFVATAAYGDYGPAYIGTEISYSQGGYETGKDASFVAPEVEGVLMKAIARLLDVDPNRIEPLK